MVVIKLFSAGSVVICVAASTVLFSNCGEIPFSFHKLHAKAHTKNEMQNSPEPEDWSSYHDAAMKPGKEGVPPIVFCPEDFESRGEMCQRVHYIKGTPSCSKKADLYENGLCITMESLKPIMKCPEGAFSDGKKCFEVTYLAPIPECPHDQKLTDDGLGCVPKFPMRAESTCPEGFQKKLNKCIREKRCHAKANCPPDFMLTYGALGAECFNSHVVTQEVSCKGMGFTIRDGQCVRIETASTIAKCPSGYKDQGDGFCAMTQTVMADSVCPEGTTRSSKGCISTRMESVVPSCKKEFTFHDGSCKKYEERPVDLKCPEGFTLKNGICTMRQYFEAEKVCPPGSLPKDKGCFLRREVPSTTICESGRLGENGLCVATTFTDPQLYCTDGKLTKGTCEKKHTNPADIECPEGSHLDGSKCVLFHKVAPDIRCKSTGARPGPEGCITTETGHMFVQCPKDWKLYGDQCFRDVTTPKLHVCPNNTTLKGRKCESRNKVPAELSCPKGYNQKGGKCMTFEEEPVQQCCPDGYRLTFGQCIPYSGKKSLRKLVSPRQS